MKQFSAIRETFCGGFNPKYILLNLSKDVVCVANRQTVVYICHVSTKIFI